MKYERDKSDGSRWLQSVVDSLPDLVLLVEPWANSVDSSITDANGRSCMQLGYDIEQLAGLKLSELVPMEYHKVVAEAFAQADAGPGTPFELDFSRRDGSTFPVEVHFSQLQIDDHDLMLLAARDITDRRRQQELRDEQYHKTLELNARLSEANEELTVMQQELKESNEQLAASHEELQMSNEELSSALEQIELSRAKVREINQLLLQDLDERTAEYYDTNLKLHEEVTRHKETLQQQLRSERLLSSVLESIPDLLSVHDHNLRVVMSNWHGHEWIAADERKAHPYCYEAYRRQDQPCEGCPAREVFDTGEIRTIEDVNPVDNRVREITCFPVFDRHGKVELVGEYVRDITERKQREEQLRRSREYFQALNRAAPVGIFWMDDNQNITYVNDYWIGITGYKLEEVQGRQWESIVHPEDRGWLLAERKQAVADNHSHNAEYRYITKHGATVWVSTRVELLHNGSDLRGLIGAVVDITAQKAWEERIIASEALHRDMFEENHAMQFIIDPRTGSIVKANRAAAEFYGYSVDELCDMGVSDLNLAPEDDIQARVEEAKSSEASKFIFRHRLASGEVRDVEVHSGPIILEGREMLYSIVFDVTEKLRIERQLRENEKYLRQTLESIDEGIWDWHVESGNLIISPGWASMLGYRVEELEPDVSTWERLMHPDDMPRAWEMVKDYLAGRTDRYELEFRMQTAEGGWLWVLARGKAVEWNDDGSITRILGVHTNIDHSKRMLDALAKSEERFELAVSGTNDGIWDWTDPTADPGRAAAPMYWSPRLFEMLGYEPDAFVPTLKRFYELVHPDDRDELATLVEQHMATGGQFQFEYRICHTDGGYLWVLSRGQVQLGEDGKPVRMSGSLQDITERKELENRLKLREQAISSSVTAICFTDLAGYLTYANAAFVRLWGLENRDDAVGRHMSEFSDDPEAYREILSQIHENGVLKTERRFAKFPAEPLDLDVTAQIVVDVNGAPHSIMAAFVDITDRKRAEEELARAHREYEQLFHHSSSGICVVSRDMELLRVNETFKQMFTVDPEAATESRCDCIMHAVCREDVCPFKQIVEEGQPRCELETEFINPQGELRKLVKTATPYYNEAGEIAGIIENFVDVTRLKAVEHELESSRRQLTHAEKLAAIGEMASGVAHELNQPLSHIRMTADILNRYVEKERWDAGEFSEQLGLIMDNITRANEVIQSLKSYARRETSGPVPINVRDAISNALTMFGAQLKSRGINLDFTYGNEELRALASVNQLGQVIINCVTNARDALSETGQANKQISIDAYRDDGKVYITVSDNGPGMPPEVSEQLFTPFFTTKEPGKGTGLGMSISQKLVEGFGGRIMCDSTPGKGTTIIIVLEEPAAEAEQAAGAG